MRIAIGSDHAGYKYKTIIIEAIRRGGKHEITDFGTDSEESVDYPTYIRPVAEAVAKHLAVLVRAGLVESETAGRERRYRIDEEQFARALAQFNAVSTAWDGRLRRIKRLAEALQKEE